MKEKEIAAIVLNFASVQGSFMWVINVGKKKSLRLIYSPLGNITLLNEIKTSQLNAFFEQIISETPNINFFLNDVLTLLNINVRSFVRS